MSDEKVKFQNVGLAIKANAVVIMLKVAPSLIIQTQDESLSMQSKDGQAFIRVPKALFPFLNPGDIAVVTLGACKTEISNVEAFQPTQQ